MKNIIQRKNINQGDHFLLLFNLTTKEGDPMKIRIQLTRVLMSFLFFMSIGLAQTIITVEGELTADATWSSENTIT